MNNAPPSWTSVVAARHALTQFPDCKYLWFLDQSALVMNPQRTIEANVMDPARLDEGMIKDYPVVPPDSIIKTFSHLRGRDVEFLLTQDKDGLSSASWVLKNGEWARFFLETWFDPLYRSYNFQKAETHALVSGPLLALASVLYTSNTEAGTHRPVAPHHPRQAGPRRPAHHQLVQHGRPRRGLPAGRPRRPLHQLRIGIGMRKGGRAIRCAIPRCL